MTLLAASKLTKIQAEIGALSSENKLSAQLSVLLAREYEGKDQNMRYRSVSDGRIVCAPVDETCSDRRE